MLPTTLAQFADVLDYPQPGLAEKSRLCAQTVARMALPFLAVDSRQLSPDALLSAFAREVEPMAYGLQEEAYASTFDLGGAYPYIGYQLLGETYKRSIFMLELKNRYHAYGLSEGGELSDHLVCILRYLNVLQDEEEFCELTQYAILPALANVVYNNSDVTLILMDNRWTCMTGHQPNPSTGADSFGDPREQADFEAILKAFGIKSVTSVYSYDQEKMTAALSEAIEFPGPAVVIATGECQLQIQRRKKWQEPVTYVDPEVCIGCRRCLDIGCSAIQFDKVARKASIDKLLCVDCGLCSQICPYGAIKERK